MEKHFNAAWDGRTDVAMEAGRFDVGAQTRAWVRLTVVPDPLGALRVDVGATQAKGRYRYTGVLFVDCWTPGSDRGTGEALGLADEVCGVFRQPPPAGVRFLAGNARPLGAEGNWTRVQVTVPYEWDAIYQE